MRRLATALALVVTTASLVAAQAQIPLPNVRAPLILRLDGTLARDKATARAQGFTAVTLGFLDGGPADVRFLAADDARTIGGDHPLLGKDVLNAVQPFDPNFLLAGPQPIVDQVRTLPGGTRIRLEGLVDPGSRVYYLRSVHAR
jgi:hypothetical protein